MPPPNDQFTTRSETLLGITSWDKQIGAARLSEQ